MRRRRASAGCGRCSGSTGSACSSSSSRRIRRPSREFGVVGRRRLRSRPGSVRAAAARRRPPATASAGAAPRPGARRCCACARRRCSGCSATRRPASRCARVGGTIHGRRRPRSPSSRHAPRRSAGLARARAARSRGRRDSRSPCVTDRRRMAVDSRQEVGIRRDGVERLDGDVLFAKIAARTARDRLGCYPYDPTPASCIARPSAPTPCPRLPLPPPCLRRSRRIVIERGRVRRPGRDQRLAPAQRHDAVADPRRSIRC